MKNLVLKSYLFFFLIILSSASFGQPCYTNFEGTYNAQTTIFETPGLNWDQCEGLVWNGAIRFESVGSEFTYKVFSTDDSLGMELEDMSMGTYYVCYDTIDQSSLPNGDLRLHLDNCNQLSISGTSQWGEVYFIDEHSIDSTGTILTLRWYNDYGERGEVELTRTDSLLWTDGTTSISKTELNKKQLDIFPNPVSDILHLKSEGDLTNAQISIIDLHGKVLLQKTITSIEINLSSFQKGIYFLEINDLKSGGKWMKKLIID